MAEAESLVKPVSLGARVPTEQSSKGHYSPQPPACVSSLAWPSEWATLSLIEYMDVGNCTKSVLFTSWQAFKKLCLQWERNAFCSQHKLFFILNIMMVLPDPGFPCLNFVLSFVGFWPKKEKILDLCNPNKEVMSNEFFLKAGLFPHLIPRYRTHIFSLGSILSTHGSGLDIRQNT